MPDVGPCRLAAPGGLFGRLGIDAAARRVVHIPTSECAKANHVNRDLRVFHECVAAAIARFPFYEAGEEERFQAAADELRERVTTLDDTALATTGWCRSSCLPRSDSRGCLPHPVRRVGAPGSAY